MTKRVLTMWIAAIALLAACSNTIDPFEEEGISFAVYGVLDTSLDTQAVRIEPVVPAVPFDVERIAVTVRDETTGIEVPMQGRVVTVDDGTPGLVYCAPLRVESGRTYTLHIALDGALRTLARITLPASRPARFEEVERSEAPDSVQLLPIVLEGPLSPPTRFEVFYTIATRADAQGRLLDSLRYGVPYAEGVPAPDGYRYRLNITRDQSLLRAVAQRSPSDTLRLLSLAVQVGQNQAARPGQVEGGVAALAAVSATTQTLALPDTLVQKLGFAPR